MHSAIVAQSFGTSVLGTNVSLAHFCVKTNLLWVRTMIRKYEEGILYFNLGLFCLEQIQ